MTKVFVSYARKDLETVEKIVTQVDHFGFQGWMDIRNLRGGVDYSEEIKKAIVDCGRFLLFVSQAAMESDYVYSEVLWAHEHKKRIVLLRIDDSSISPALKPLIKKIQWVNYSDPDWKSRLLLALDDQQADPPPWSRKNLWAAIVVAFVIVAGLYLLWPAKCAYAGDATTDSEAITWLIEHEALAVTTENMDLIKAIFTEDVIIEDVAANGGTPEKWFHPTDRYQPLFENYDYLEAENINIKATGPINNDTVEYISGSYGKFTNKGIPGEYNNPDNASQWTATKIDGCWKITRFMFNLH